MAGDAGADVLILGGGTAGCVLAARLSEDAGTNVVLVEGGPDYGSLDDGGWPDDMLDGRRGSSSHDWTDGENSLMVARVIGGCSSHNLCFWIHPAPEDWDEVAAITGDPAWSAEGIAPAIARAEERMPLALRTGDEIDPWLRTLMDAADELGLGSGANVNELREGAAPMPLNARGTIRWSAAFGYLDEARARPNLTILDDCLVDTVVFDRSRAIGAVVRGDGEERTLAANRVIVSAGAYGSPAILLRSGIGPSEELARHGIEQRADLPVGSALRDHFQVRVRLAPSEEMQRRLDDDAGAAGRFVCEGVVKGRSSGCEPGLWDLHSVAISLPAGDAGFTDREGDVLAMSAGLLRPRWTGTVRLRSTDPGVLPEVSPHDLDDPADLAVALEGIDLCLRLAGTEAARWAWTEQLVPPPDLEGDNLAVACQENIAPYFHPVASCAMGRAGDGESTVDGDARVHGFENLYVCDGSIIPRTPRANTNLPVIAAAELIAERLSA